MSARQCRGSLASSAKPDGSKTAFFKHNKLSLRTVHFAFCHLPDDNHPLAGRFTGMSSQFAYRTNSAQSCVPPGLLKLRCFFCGDFSSGDAGVSNQTSRFLVRLSRMHLPELTRIINRLKFTSSKILLLLQKV